MYWIGLLSPWFCKKNTPVSRCQFGMEALLLPSHRDIPAHHGNPLPLNVLQLVNGTNSKPTFLGIGVPPKHLKSTIIQHSFQRSPPKKKRRLADPAANDVHGVVSNVVIVPIDLAKRQLGKIP